MARPSKKKTTKRRAGPVPKWADPATASGFKKSKARRALEGATRKGVLSPGGATTILKKTLLKKKTTKKKATRKKATKKK